MGVKRGGAQTACMQVLVVEYCFSIKLLIVFSHSLVPRPRISLRPRGLGTRLVFP